MDAEGQALEADGRPPAASATDDAGQQSATATPLAEAPDAAVAAPALLVPALLAGIDAADDYTRQTAGYAVGVLTDEYPAVATALAEELVTRLRTDPDHTGAARTLATLAGDHADAVRQALATVDDRQQAHEFLARIRGAEPWTLPRALQADGGEATTFTTAFRQVIRLTDHVGPEAPDSPGATGGDATEDAERLDQGDPDADRPDPGDRDAESETTAEEAPEAAVPDGPGIPEETSKAVLSRRERIERAAESRTFRTITARSGFDDLDVVAPETERRYANVIRARASADDTAQGVAVRLLQTPEDRAIFDPAAGASLEAWASLVDVPGVVTVVDWGERPQPWVVTEYVEETLANRGRVDPARALREARALAETLVELHQHDVAHGGIDPRNVVYPADAIDGGRPMLDNVGLLSVYRQHVDPADYLDPRYAAPEYFDSEFGRLDHATDVYQLGMVLYRLFAGRHPFDGSYESVRAAVLTDRPPAPSDATPALPTAVDEVVAKATAKQKLTRYETASGLHRDLVRICEALD